MSPKQWGGEGVRAGQGRACPVCSQRYDVSIGGWRCGHGVTRSSSFAEKVSAAITRRDEVSPAPLAGTEREGGDSGMYTGAGRLPASRACTPSLAGAICSHGYTDWTECAGCCWAADFDDGVVGLA